MTEEKPRLGRDVYIALAAVGWADGRLDAEEADAIVRTALEEGLDLESIREIEAATGSPVEISELERRSLTFEDRLFIYAVACWIARLDGDMAEGEKESMRRLGTILEIGVESRQLAAAATREISAQRTGDRPLMYDLPGLRREIDRRLFRKDEG